MAKQTHDPSLDEVSNDVHSFCADLWSHTSWKPVSHFYLTQAASVVQSLTLPSPLSPFHPHSKRYMQFPNGSLQILMTTPDDAGIFTCKVSSGDLQEFRQVSLHFPAEPLVGDTLVEVHAGTTARLPCLLPRRTTPSHWHRLDDGPMNARFKILRDGALLVPTVGLQDDGRYSCVAKSQAGNIYSPALRLKVTGGLTITKPPGDLEILAGKRAEFPCTVSDKHANIIWTR
uniref:Ig-like domain-containing protein n=1 Tax=Eptatretus burgeri TaxID=7764 RepID=A0A8C4WXF3_EPTBU